MILTKLRSYNTETKGRCPDAVMPMLRAAADVNACGGCGRQIGGVWGGVLGPTAYVTALGRRWHPGCLVCGHCGASIANEVRLMRLFVWMWVSSACRCRPFLDLPFACL